MATFNYTVDTNPMADEISSVSRHVDATTGAVVAMQTAVIIAEEKAANHVCNNVNKGFYSLIRSQISQKMAKFQSEVDSQLMQMAQQKNALLGIKNRMQRDYNMISSRYIKLFNGLNVNLKNRVFELDKPTIDFACKEIDKVSNRAKYLTAIIPITQLESITLSQKIVASNVKQKGFSVINSMKKFLFEMETQKKLTDEILINDNKYTETASAFVPVLISEFNRDKTESKSIEINVPEVVLDNLSKSSIKNNIHTRLSEIEWVENDELNSEIISEVSKLSSDSQKSKRIKDLTMKLFLSNKYQTI